MINILIVDDSPSCREFLAEILAADPELQVIGRAGSGREALAMLGDLTPDIILLDGNMPELDGMATAKRIMETCPKPILMVTGAQVPEELAGTFDRMVAGVLDIVRKPPGHGHPHHRLEVATLRAKIKALAGIRVVKRRQTCSVARPPVCRAGHPLVVVGASTGGPGALKELLGQFPEDFSAPLLIVQHMAGEFLPGLVEWLNKEISLKVEFAVDNQPLLPGTVYVGPAGANLTVNCQGRVSLQPPAVAQLHCPSACHLFRSVARSHGSCAVGVLLTGMGSDGAEGLLAMKEAGAMTYVQDEASCAVFGMPKAAIYLGADCYRMPPEEIGASIVRRMARENRP